MPSKQAKFAEADERLTEAEGDGNSLAQSAGEIYGTPGQPPAPVSVPNETKRITPTDIFKIWSDSRQPRRSAPSEARRAWNGNPAEVKDVLKRWQALAQAECDQPLDLEALLSGQIEVHRPESGPLASYLNLVDLAIALRGVDGNSIPPANVVRVDGGFILEFGERRWLAHHLLHGLFPHENWGEIPAVEVKEINVWRQAAENGARQDLNAVGKARQLAILIMDLLIRVKKEEFYSFEQMVSPGKCDRAFYAQVADGERYRLPRGSSSDIIAATGLKSADQIRRYRGLLDLPDEIWTKADDEDWSEGYIRSLSEPDTEGEEDTVTNGTVSDDKPKPPRSDKPRPIKPKTFKKVFSRYFDGLSAEEKRARTTEIRQWLDEVEQGE